MEYSKLLESAYNNVELSDNLDSGKANGCSRFEIRKVEGHHLGSRTVVSNFMQIVSCLRRDKEHLMKFLCKEMASQCELSGDRLILSRKVSSKDLNNKIERYVKMFVLCPTCGKPDTELVEENGKIVMRCLACGKTKEVHNI